MGCAVRHHVYGCCDLDSEEVVKTILLDCDGVVLNCAAAVHQFAQRMLARKLNPPESWKSYDFREAMELTKSEWEFIVKMLERKDKIGHLIGYYPQAQSFIEHLGFDNKVVFATTPWRGLNHWVEARYGLLDHFLNRRNYSIVFTSEKHLIQGDWLIDDKFDNMDKTPERGILFSRPWNLKFENFAAYVARNYADVLAIVEPQVDAVSTIEQIKPHVQKVAARKETKVKKRL